MFSSENITCSMPYVELFTLVESFEFRNQPFISELVMKDYKNFWD